MIPTNAKLRILHYPNIPCNPFIVEVKDEAEAKKVIDTLANQHLWLYENNFIPDYSNSIVVEMYDETIDDETNEPYGWLEYYNDAECMDFAQIEETYFPQGD